MDGDYNGDIFTGDNSGSLIMCLKKVFLTSHQFCNDPDRLMGPSSNENA